MVVGREMGCGGGGGGNGGGGGRRNTSIITQSGNSPGTDLSAADLSPHKPTSANFVLLIPCRGRGALVRLAGQRWGHVNTGGVCVEENAECVEENGQEGPTV